MFYDRIKHKDDGDHGDHGQRSTLLAGPTGFDSIGTRFPVIFLTWT